MPSLEGLDLGTSFWFQSQRNPSRDAFMIDITALGGATVLMLVTLFAFGLLLSLQRYRTAFFILVAVITGSLLMEGAKQLVGRERPYNTHPGLALPPTSPSFPSG